MPFGASTHMDQQIFTDGIGRISVIGGIVRLDLVTYSATQLDARGQPQPVLTHRIVMGTDAFLRSSEKILQVVRQLTGPQPPRVAASQPAPPRPQIAAPAPEQPKPAAPPPKAPFP